MATRVIRRLVCSIAVLATVATRAGAEPTTRPFGRSIGINVKFTQGESPRDLALLKELGVHWVRDTASWPDVEPTAGQYKPFAMSFRERLAFYKENDIGVVFGLWYDNPSAYPNTPDDPTRSTDADAYGRYAAEVARQLKRSGVRFVIELYNEPHNTLIKTYGGKWNGEPPSPWLDHYVKMVDAAVKQVKAFDPATALLVDDDMWAIHYRFLERGLPKAIDGMAIHPYAKHSPERAAVDQDTNWAAPFAMVDADGSFNSAVRRLRARATDALGRTPSIWITEWGWPIGEDIEDRPMTDERLAAFIPRAYLAANAAGVEALLWFSIQDSVDGPMGLTTNDGKHRATFDAFRTMSLELGTCTDLEQIAGADHPTTGVQVYRLRDGAKSKLVAWNINGTSPARLTASDVDAVRLVDVFGRPISAPKAGDAELPITLSPSPMYISTADPTAWIKPVIEPSLKPTFLFP